MKKFLSLTLCLVLTVCTLTACGKSEEGAKDDNAEKGNNADTAKLTAKVIDIDLTSEEYAFGVDKSQPELLETVNKFTAEIKSNGTFEAICNNYFGDGTPVAVTSAALDPNKEQLVVATNAAFEPFEYTKGDSYYGIDMEIAAKLAEYLGQELVIQHMDFDAVCLAVGQQKCDIAMAGLTIKEDRLEHVNFSDSYYTASQKLIIPSDNTEFDACKDAAAVEAILNAKDSSTKIGVQNGTTGQLYCEGDEEWEFAGYKVTTVGYKNGSLAVQDLLNGNINYVVIDSAPAAFITEAINKMR